MSTTAALIEGHWITARYPDAACQCGAQFEWNDRDKAHALHLLDVVRAEERERIARNIEADVRANTDHMTNNEHRGMARAIWIAKEGA